MNTAHKTAISRKKPSAPMRHLFATGRLIGRKLDYGSDKGHDAETYRMDSYDPHYQPDMPEGLFDTITCNYVLNVITSNTHRFAVLQDILSRLADDGSAYITVRTDKRALKSTTKTGSWQGFILLDLPVVTRDSGYKTYLLQHGDLDNLTMVAHTF